MIQRMKIPVVCRLSPFMSQPLICLTCSCLLVRV
jgi:hypothetical protein